MTTGQPNKRPVGRGGAGNFTNQMSPELTPQDLETPTLRAGTYTTGRGGAGNMQVSDASKARLAQDVSCPPRRESNSTPIGRGGAGNFVHPPKDKKASEHAIDDSSPRNSGEHSRARGMLDKVMDKFHGAEKKDNKNDGPGSPPKA
ncbi:uncharacterized protein MKZ38_002225 [Zalerion maritima]|uniref:Uncharacterized protein n=1 Tax=Zalerion maritima TaxID=339359 RepID=A0AAD5RP87_9PEZI|nr:uncharacterized protein MKZ38_002225 [Zalerion maritima]